MDKERDTVQDQLDQKAQAYFSLENECTQVKKELLRAKDRLSELLGKNEETQFRHQNTVEELLVSKKQVKALAEENDEVKQACFLKETALTEMGNDLDVLTREHQNLT